MSPDSYRLSLYRGAAPDSLRPATINDCTLREGEQSSEAAFSVADRCQIAAALNEAGVQRIQIGLKSADPGGNRAVVQAAGSSETEALIIAFLPDWKKQIDTALEAGVTHLNIIYRASPALLALLGSSVDDLIQTSVAAISYGREQGGRTIYSPGDTMRAEWSTLEAAYRAAVDAGVEAVYVLDTVGVAWPSAISDVVGKVVELTGLPVGVHAHNDLGLGLANALAAYAAGATIIDTCVNGMGDRCGNPSVDEVVVACELIYGCPTGVRLDSMMKLSQLVADLSGVAVSPNKPLVGVNANSHKLDIHVRAMQADPLAFQPLRPELVGAKARIVLGKNSGPLTLRARIAELGLEPLSEDQVPLALELVNSYADANKRSVPDRELSRIVTEVRAHKP